MAEFDLETMPLPFGVTASGDLLNELTDREIAHLDPLHPAAADRARNADKLVFAQGVKPERLDSAGWGIVFPRDIDPAIKDALAPLIEHRRRQVNNEDLFQIFENERGVRPTDSPKGWVQRHGADFMEVEPTNGVPLYLLLIGSPRQIPFEFQYALDSWWNVGRLDFDQPSDYAAYAAHVIRYETQAQVANRKEAVLWNVKNPGDKATGLLHNLVAKPLAEGNGKLPPVGKNSGFRVRPLFAEAATKQALAGVLAEDPPPALLFTGSHGMAFPALDHAARRELQGALLCQDWPGQGAPLEAHYLTGAEIEADAHPFGVIHFLFACYGGGCPQFDDYQRDLDGQKKPLLDQPITARVPQALLKKGALAVLAHIDRAWNYSFQSGTGRGQYQGFRSVLDRLLDGERIGQATDSFNQRWGPLGNELLDVLQRKNVDNEPIPTAAIANRWVARNDARNYLILGDPAVRLRVEDMAN